MHISFEDVDMGNDCLRYFNWSMKVTNSNLESTWVQGIKRRRFSFCAAKEKVLINSFMRIMETSKFGLFKWRTLLCLGGSFGTAKCFADCKVKISKRLAYWCSVMVKLVNLRINSFVIGRTIYLTGASPKERLPNETRWDVHIGWEKKGARSLATYPINTAPIYASLLATVAMSDNTHSSFQTMHLINSRTWAIELLVVE